ncbi:syntaxin [Chlorella sorokiniana]|uniref:Syntaxin n=1 Tax=Chlorella sorokiniana TaxID=3076 RepID=A0A2P6TZK2_CHLSO|nr:syntaxin [Chlorella sorokiniana]|eukprot:PRW59489.1 syntaxin [Chlorella sorokiniana]
MPPRGGREPGALAAGGGSDAAAATTELKGIQFRAVTAFNRLRDDVGRLGTAQDTTELRRRIAEGSARFKGLAQEFRAAAARHPARDSSAAQKLLRDFQGLLRSSERLMESAKAKEAASLPRPAGAAAAAAAAQQQELSEAARADAERRALLEEQRKQELLSVENSLQFNEAVIEERDQAIVEITGQIGEVHQIFQDLAVLVVDQGEMLDDIESNITRAAERTADASVQISRAERSQRSARSKWCFLLVITMIVVGLLMLIILA